MRSLPLPLLTLLSSPILAAAQDSNSTEPRLGAVASQNQVCSDIGIQLLRDGGNAVDAIVGTVFCVGVLNPYHCGIGGGGFVTLRTPEGEYETVDFREMAPAASFQDMYKDDESLSIYGGLARYVPPLYHPENGDDEEKEMC
jgi:gamma-glutamyltranspeptidase / glutathione hydrolase